MIEVLLSVGFKRCLAVYSVGMVGLSTIEEKPDNDDKT